MTTKPTDFVGAKGALFFGQSVLTLQRDDLPGLRWAGMWDLPGGGREGDEGPADCFLRELQEELSLTLSPARLEFAAEIPSVLSPDKPAWLFSARIFEADFSEIRLGDEGQAWSLCPIDQFLTNPLAIPQMQDRVRLAAGALGLIVSEARL